MPKRMSRLALSTAAVSALVVLPALLSASPVTASSTLPPASVSTPGTVATETPLPVSAIGGITIAGTERIPAALLPGYLDYIDMMWSMVSWIHPDAVRPATVVERTVGATEVAEITVTCLRGEGFPNARVVDHGGVEPGIEAVTEPEKYHIALYVCAARYPIT